MPQSLRNLLLLFCLAPCLWSATTVRFEPAIAEAGPFPTDFLTVVDSRQETGLRVNLPMPAMCAGSPTSIECASVALLNQVDGFSLNPQAKACFSGDINPASLPGALSFQAPGSMLSIPANQIYYDPASKCVFAKPQNILNQQSKYLFLVGNSVLDIDGLPVTQSPAFTNCITADPSPYCGSLRAALGSPAPAVATASLFTTLSATAWLQDARQMVNRSSTPYLAVPAGLFTSFNVSNLKEIAWYPQNSSQPSPQVLSLSALAGVDKIAFGLFLSPNFINVSGPTAGTITTIPTKNPIQSLVPVPGLTSLLFPGYVAISMHLYLPPQHLATSGKFPVVIYGHGLGDSQFGAPHFIAGKLAQNGIATLAFEVLGHGFGAGSYVRLTNKFNLPTFVATPGRGISLAPGAPIGPTDGCIAPGPVATRDCGRQSAIDLFALVRTIKKTNGLGQRLDPNRIYYAGQSFGSLFGTLFHAVEPGVSKAVLNVGGGSMANIARLAMSGRPLGMAYLGMFNPPLLNVPPAPPQAYFHDAFNDDYVYRDQGVTISSVPGAVPIQAAFEVAEWLGMTGDPLAYARHLKTAPLAGVPVKQTLFQFGLGDLEVPNPTESALVRAAGGQDSTWFLRFDIAASIQPQLLGLVMPGFPLPIMPHRFLANPTIFDGPAQQSIALAAQQQAAGFYTGPSIPEPNQFLTGPFTGVPLFEVPAALPEQLNFLQIQP